MKKTNTSVKVAIAIAVLGSLWMLSGVFNDNKALEAEKTQKIQQIRKVSVTISQAQAYERSLIVRGRTQASRNVMIRSEVKAPVRNITAKRGAFLAKGDIIAILSPQDKPAAVAEQEARVKELEAKLAAAQKLFDKGYRGATDLAAAEANLEQALAGLETAHLNLSNTRIKAPFDGILADRPVEQGDYLNTGDNIAHIVDLDPLYIVAEVSEVDVGLLYTGMEGTAKTVTGIHRDGFVHYIAPTANDITRTYQVEMTVENPGYKIPSGLTTEISIPLKTVQAHKIPPSALSLSDDGTVGVKHVLINNTVKFQEIEILADENDGVWVDGLPQRFQLINVGQEYVTDGETVEPVFNNEEGS